MDITRLGHATLLLETDAARLLIDPGTFSDRWHDLTGLDAIAVTHQHRDHLDVDNLPALVESNPDAALWVEPQAAEVVSQLDPRPAQPGERFTAGDVTVEIVGGTHALIHQRIPRVGNVGFVVSRGSGPRLFHPGDSYDTAPQQIDVLAAPLCAPWANVAATVGFIEAVQPTRMIPIHDAIASDAGRRVYADVVGGLCEGVTRFDDPAIGDIYRV